MHTEQTPAQKARFWDKLYKAGLILGIIYGCVLATVATRQAFIVTQQLKETTQKVDRTTERVDQTTQNTQDLILCIGEYFTRTDRATLQIESLETCRINGQNIPLPSAGAPRSSQQPASDPTPQQSQPSPGKSNATPTSPQPGIVQSALKNMGNGVQSVIDTLRGRQ
jgi:hypothetical protein